jgi:small nuclear ribonucleoprotein (snRNP)-like protein
MQEGTTFTGAGRELSGAIFSLDQYHNIILMLCHQFPSSNMLNQGKSNSPKKKVRDCLEYIYLYTKTQPALI